VPMMNRRALVRAHSHWRPRVSELDPVAGDGDARAPGGVHRRRVALLALGVAACVAGGWLLGRISFSSATDTGSLPQTPAAWLDSFMAAAVRDPGRLCSQLVTPGFRAALARDVGESCVGYYSRTSDTPFRILRILRSGNTAALEVRAWPRGSYTTFVLSRNRDGWQALAVVPGGPLPVA
jgi:hypothetical protein